MHVILGGVSDAHEHAVRVEFRLSCHAKIPSSDLHVIKEASIHPPSFEEKLGGMNDERYVGGFPIAIIDVLMCDLQRL